MIKQITLLGVFLLSLLKIIITKMRRRFFGEGEFEFTIIADKESNITIGDTSIVGIQHSAKFKKGDEVPWSVSREGFITQSGVQTITENVIKNITLSTLMLDVTITSNVDSTITIDGQSFSNTKSATVSVAWNSSVSWSVSATGYVTQSGTLSNVRTSQTKAVSLSLQTFTVTVTSNVNSTITINGDSTSGTRSKSVTVNYGSNVSWSVSASGYETQSGTISNVRSNQTKSVTLVEPYYTYTVYSDIEGASVYFDGSYYGEISGGSYSTSIRGGDTYYNVTISGGSLPSDYRATGSTTTERETETGTDTETDTENNFSVSPSSASFAQGGGSASISVVSNYRNKSRSRSKSRTKSRSRTPYTDYSYSRPGQSRVERDDYVYMNAVESSSLGVSYGSWSYGSWSYGSWSSWSYGSYTRSSSLSVSGESWISSSKSNAGSGSSLGYTVNLTASSNGTYSSRNGSVSISSSQGSGSVSVSQPGMTNSYEFNINTSLLRTSAYASADSLGLAAVLSKKNGSSFDGFSITSCPSWIHLSLTNSGDSTFGYTVTVSANSSTSQRSGTVTFTQNESGKQVSFTITQAGKKVE